MPVRVTRLGAPARVPASAELRRRGARMLGALGLGDAELSISLSDDATIRALNRRHRRRDRPTDVLAFPLDAPTRGGPGPRLLGDVVVSADTARAQARARGVSLLEEVTALLAHGILHLAGFDHATDAEERRMNALADVLVAAARRRRAPRARGTKPARRGRDAPARRPRGRAGPAVGRRDRP